MVYTAFFSDAESCIQSVTCPRKFTKGRSQCRSVRNERHVSSTASLSTSVIGYSPEVVLAHDVRRSPLSQNQRRKHGFALRPRTPMFVSSEKFGRLSAFLLARQSRWRRARYRTRMSGPPQKRPRVTRRTQSLPARMQEEVRLLRRSTGWKFEPAPVPATVVGT